jgi:hypothetical protein
VADVDCPVEEIELYFINLAHAELFSFWFDDDDGSERSGYQLQKYQRSKDGLHSINPLSEAAADLRKLAEDTRKLTEAIWEQCKFYELHILQVFPSVKLD